MNNTKALKEVDNFDVWLRDKIKNVYYANNPGMIKAYEIVYNNNL